MPTRSPFANPTIEIDDNTYRPSSMQVKTLIIAVA